jgi:hypothetical protein
MFLVNVRFGDNFVVDFHKTIGKTISDIDNPMMIIMTDGGFEKVDVFRMAKL